MSNLTSGLSSRIFGLDFLRFLAITLVLVEHGNRYLTPALRKERLFYMLGYFGVELFFVLSGFLIGAIIIKLYETEQKLSFGLIKNFWIRRWFRTIPLYYLILVVNIAGNELFGAKSYSSTTYISFFAFVQNAVTHHPLFFGEAWSLSVEEWFYLSLPLVLFLFDKGMFFSAGRNISVKTKTLMGLLFFFVVIVSLRISVVQSFDPEWNAGVRKIMPLRLDAILIGVFFSWLNYYYHSFFAKSRYYLLAAGAGMVACATSIYYHDVYHNTSPGFFTKTIYFTLTDLAFALLLPAAMHFRIKNQGFATKAITHISLTSYSIYLLHQSIIIKGLTFFGKPDSLVSSFLFYGAYIGLTLVASTILYKYFELPMTNLRERFKRKKPKTVVIALEPVFL